MLTVTYAECHTKAPYAECRYAECNGTFFYFAGVWSEFDGQEP